MQTVREIVSTVGVVMERHGILIKDLPEKLNFYLNPEDQITSNERSATVQISRWLNHEVEPKAHIVLAMKEFLKHYR